MNSQINKVLTATLTGTITKQNKNPKDSCYNLTNPKTFRYEIKKV